MQDGVMVSAPQQVVPAGQFTPAVLAAPGQLLAFAVGVAVVGAEVACATVVGATVVGATQDPTLEPQVFPEGQQNPVPVLVQQTSPAVQKELRLKPALQKVDPAGPQRASEEAPGPRSPPQTALAGHWVDDKK